ncbi:MAG: hypothetical protein IRY95_08300, partial [Clostridia bacterium]|nr:hypothetical protein [Clostridia bacterium]
GHDPSGGDGESPPRSTRSTGDGVAWVIRCDDWRACSEALQPLLADAQVPKVSFDAKPWVRATLAAGGGVEALAFDGAIAAYLLDPARTSYRLEDQVRTYLGYELPPLPDAGRRPRGRANGATGAAGETPPGEAPAGAPAAVPEPAAAATAARATAVLALVAPLRSELVAQGLERLFDEVEMPLVEVLAAMEVAGLPVDVAVLEELGRTFEERMAEIAEEIHQLAGERFNIQSTQQLGEILFGKLGLPTLKKTKTRFSTDAEVLEELSALHPLPAKVLAYRQLAKLKGTYVDGLRAQVDPRTGRVHSSFNQTVAATGRISSSEPNLQNIPVRDPLGRQLRRAFVAPPGRLLVAADYSQIELRVLAHMAGDERLIRAFREGRDIHRATAAEVFGVAPEAVTPEMRERAKAVNFGIVYGISDFGLARNLRIPRDEARAYIESYFARYPGVRAYTEDVVRQARRNGYVRTLFGRIRHLPEINSRVFARRQFSERMALNTPIQGTAADIIKKAMVEAHRALKREGLAARLILQVLSVIPISEPTRHSR